MARGTYVQPSEALFKAYGRVKNPPFVYHRPETMAEALAVLAEHGDDAKVLAGGQSLLPTMALRLGPPAHVVDIGRVPDLDTINVSDDGTVIIGALVRHAEAENSPELAQHAPLVHQAMPYIGHRAIRTRGTVVGSIAHADPAAEMPAVALAADAAMVVQSANGERTIDAGDFFVGYLETVLRPAELLAEVRFPPWSVNAGGALVELSRRHGDYALVGLACRVEIEDGTISSAALSFFGADSTPVRVAEAEAALVGRPPTDAAYDEAAAIVSASLTPSADIHGTANYRRHLAGVLSRRGLAQAVSEIGVLA